MEHLTREAPYVWAATLDFHLVKTLEQTKNPVVIDSLQNQQGNIIYIYIYIFLSKWKQKTLWETVGYEQCRSPEKVDLLVSPCSNAMDEAKLNRSCKGQSPSD